MTASDVLEIEARLTHEFGAWSREATGIFVMTQEILKLLEESDVNEETCKFCGSDLAGCRYEIASRIEETGWDFDINGHWIVCPDCYKNKKPILALCIFGMDEV